MPRNSFVPDDDKKKNSFVPDDVTAMPAASNLPPRFNPVDATLRGIGELGSDVAGAAMKGLDAAQYYGDKYIGAPLNAGISAMQDTAERSPGSSLFLSGIEAAKNQFGEEPEGVPSNKDIMKRFGLGTKETIPMFGFGIGPDYLEKGPDPKYNVSPAGLAGEVYGSIKDPMNLVIPAAGKVAKFGGEALMKGAEALSPKVAEYLMEKAANRALKASTGENVGALRRISRVTGKSAGDVERAEKDWQAYGRNLLEADEAGKPALGFISNVRDIAGETADKRRFYGEKIGKTGEIVDRAFPQGSVDGESIAIALENYANEIPDVGKGSELKKRIAEEAEKLRAKGQMTFAEAQKVKNQYEFKPQDADALYSNGDVTNKIERVVSDEMEGAVERASGHISGDMPAVGPQRPPMAGEMGPVPPTPPPPGSPQEILDAYRETKRKYGLYKSAADAGTEQVIREQKRRLVSPSDYGTGATAALVTSVATGGHAIPAMIAGAAGAGANKVAREYGPAFAARSLKAMSDVARASPEVLGKFAKLFEPGAMLASGGALAYHHMLMQNDPEYRKLAETMSEPGQSTEEQEPSGREKWGRAPFETERVGD